MEEQKAYTYEYESHISLFDRINRTQGRSLKWWAEDRESMVKVILTDEKRSFRRALYKTKKAGNVEKEALTELIKGYCHDFELRY